MDLVKSKHIEQLLICLPTCCLLSPFSDTMVGGWDASGGTGIKLFRTAQFIVNMNEVWRDLSDEYTKGVDLMKI